MSVIFWWYSYKPSSYLKLCNNQCLNWGAKIRLKLNHISQYFQSGAKNIGILTLKRLEALNQNVTINWKYFESYLKWKWK